MTARVLAKVIATALVRRVLTGFFAYLVGYSVIDGVIAEQAVTTFTFVVVDGAIEVYLRHRRTAFNLLKQRWIAVLGLKESPGSTSPSMIETEAHARAREGLMPVMEPVHVDEHKG